MYKFFGLVLLSALAAVEARRININEPLDRIIEYLNNKQRQEGAMSALLPEISLGSKVTYSHATFLGVDSLRRTADCWQELEGNDATFDINYGFGLLTVVLPHLEIAGTNMSAYARVRDNSVHLSYTVHIEGEACSVKLNELKVERMGNVEFGASRSEYDGSNVDGFFKLGVVTTLNSIVDSNFQKIEAPLQALCKVKDFQDSGHLEQLVMSLL